MSSNAPIGLSLARLVRLPNWFTAIADVLAGMLIAQGFFPDRQAIALLVAASCALYAAGMVLNDFFDRHVDAVERPDRPIPSGAISSRLAAWLGVELLLIGVGLGWHASYVLDSPRPGIVATGLAALILAYDAFLKRTPLRPFAMGGCRTLNWLLGLSVAIAPWTHMQYIIAAGVGIYIAGVTIFGQAEAETNIPRLPLIIGVAIMLAGLGTAMSYPYFKGEFDLPVQEPTLWVYAWIVLAISIIWRFIAAINDPSRSRVQYAVKHGLMSLIVVDAVLTLPVVSGGLEPLWIAVLVLPMMSLGRWVYST